CDRARAQAARLGFAGTGCHSGRARRTVGGQSAALAGRICRNRQISRGVRRAGAAVTEDGAEERGTARSFLAGVANHLRGVAVGRFAEPDKTFAAILHQFAAYEGFLASFPSTNVPFVLWSISMNL